MSPTKVKVSTTRTAGSVVSAQPRPAASNAPPGSSSLPLVIAQSQAYYWSRRWQDGVQLARDEYARGEYEEFDSSDPNDVIHWLFSVDEDE